MAKSKIWGRERGGMYNFPVYDIIGWYRGLPVANKHYVRNQYLQIRERIAIVTIDDGYDPATISLLNKNGAGMPRTHFLFSDNKDEIGVYEDIGLHFDKGLGTLKSQVSQFTKRFGNAPLVSRNHRAWWRSDNLDLAHLAMSGVKVDSSKAGVEPYLTCVEGRLLPIWEVPYSFYEFSTDTSLHATYSVAGCLADLFTYNVTPIVGCFHPLSMQNELGFKSKLFDFMSMGVKSGYKFMTMTQFYNEILQPKYEEIMK